MFLNTESRENQDKFITEDSIEESGTNNQEANEEYYDNISRYLADISKFEELSHEKVIELYQSLQSEDETIKQQAREILVNCNLKLVWFIAKKVLGSTYHPFFLDAIAEGNLALIEKVIPRFDPSKGYRFSSYAVSVIDEAIRKAVASHNMPMFKKGSVPGFQKAKQIFQELEIKNQSTPSFEELNEELKKQRIRKISKATYNALFIHTVLEYLDKDPENGLSKYETIEDSRVEKRIFDRLAKVDFQRVLEKAMASKFLKEREKEILRKRYKNNQSLREIALEYKLSPERINQILETALGKLRRKIVSVGINKEDLFD